MAAAETIAVGSLRVAALDGGAWARIHGASVDAAGRVAFCASRAGTGGRDAIVLADRAGARPVAEAGDESPAGGRYRAFGELRLDEDGDLLFTADLEGARAACGLFLRTADGVRTIALAGEESPAGAPYARFHRPRLVSWTDAGGRRLRLAFVADLADGGRALVERPLDGVPRTLLTAGARLAGDVVTAFVPSGLGFGLCCVTSLRGPSGAVFRRAILADQGRAYWREAVREGGELPGLGTILRILAPAAVNVQMGVAAVECGRGPAALVTVPPAMVEPEVLVRSGDRLPGLPEDEVVSGLGPPVASGGVPPGGAFGIACAARLAGGGTALWLGVFGGQVPLRGEAVVPLVAGDPTDDGHVVTGFRPLELTNGGVLLLRADLGGRTALLVLDGLFDWYRR